MQIKFIQIKTNSFIKSWSWFLFTNERCVHPCIVTESQNDRWIDDGENGAANERASSRPPRSVSSTVSAQATRGLRIIVVLHLRDSYTV